MRKKKFIVAGLAAILVVVGVGFTPIQEILDENGNSPGTIICADIEVGVEIESLDQQILAAEQSGHGDGGGMLRSRRMAHSPATSRWRKVRSSVTPKAELNDYLRK
jgi:hypothetical protein